MSSEAKMATNQVVQAKAKESWINKRPWRINCCAFKWFPNFRRLAIEQDRNKYSFHHPIHLGVLYRRVCKS